MDLKIKENYEINKEKIKDRRKKYNEKSREKRSEYDKIYNKNNKLKRSEYHKKYRKDNREERNKNFNKYQNKRKKEDLVFSLKCNIRSLINNSFKRGNNKFKKDEKTEKILGCSIIFFISYISLKFKNSMTIENHGEWHLDHIVPLATAKTEDDVIRLNHYTNFQPLWAKDNMSKSNKIIEQQLVLL